MLTNGNRIVLNILSCSELNNSNSPVWLFESSQNLLEVRLNLMIKHDDGLLPVSLAPARPRIIISHNFALLAESVDLLNGHVVQLLQILLYFRLRHVIIHLELCNVVSVGFWRAEEVEFVTDEVDFSWRLLKPTSDGWLETFGVHVLLEIETLFVVFV